MVLVFKDRITFQNEKHPHQRKNDRSTEEANIECIYT